MTLRNRDILSARLSEDDTATYFFGLEIVQDRLPFDDFFPKKNSRILGSYIRTEG
jgi:hypothetical protein